MRHNTRPTILLAALLLLVCATLLGCPRAPEVTPSPTTAAGPGGPPTGPTTQPGPGAGGEASVPSLPSGPGGAAITPDRPTGSTQQVRPQPVAPLKDVFFDFDEAKIRDDQKTALNDNVTWLRTNGKAKITVEGHCDERGTPEYNLALGEHRAKAVKDYLVAAGVTADRIATISYGEERPFIVGHDEGAWKWNRRGHIVTGVSSSGQK